MVVLPLLDEEELPLVVAYSRSSDEQMDEAVVNAFLAANIDVFDRPTTLVDWVNTDVFEDLQWSSGHHLYLCTLIWSRQVVITPEEIRIYAPSNEA